MEMMREIAKWALSPVSQIWFAGGKYPENGAFESIRNYLGGWGEKKRPRFHKQMRRT